jgi:RsiW-degrading membrane proteinase PrsW (M82 family)
MMTTAQVERWWEFSKKAIIVSVSVAIVLLGVIIWAMGQTDSVIWSVALSFLGMVTGLSPVAVIVALILERPR